VKEKDRILMASLLLALLFVGGVFAILGGLIYLLLRIVISLIVDITQDELNKRD